MFRTICTFNLLSFFSVLIIMDSVLMVNLNCSKQKACLITWNDKT